MSNTNNLDQRISQFTIEVLLAHNACRSRHGSPPLTLDARLSADCMEYAAYLLESEPPPDGPRFPYRGENICVMTSINPEDVPHGEIPVNEWYKQQFDLDSAKELENNEGVVGFSQIVWKSTELLGVGFASSATKIAVVCHYVPQGNVSGESSKNFLPQVNEMNTNN